MELKERSVRYSDKSINVPATNKQGATKLVLESEESEFKLIYAQFLLQLTYVCN